MALDQARVQALFDYDPVSGELTWKERPASDFRNAQTYRMWTGRYLGRRAGSYDYWGYLTIKIDGTMYKAHRVIWLYVHGVWPDEIDHDDGRESDNGLANLKSGTHADNMKNMKIRKDNKSGVTGVCFYKATCQWKATIGQEFLGLYYSFDEAVEVRKKAEKRLGYKSRR